MINVIILEVTEFEIFKGLIVLEDEYCKKISFCHEFRFLWSKVISSHSLCGLRANIMWNKIH